MLTCFMRSGLMVNDEIPMSYFLPLTPLMMLPKSAGCHSVLTPNLAATCIEEIDVDALDGLAVAGQELVGGVGWVGADLDHARALDALGQLGWQGPRSR